MTAALRFGLAASAIALSLAPAAAQEAPATNTPATDSVGPRELRGFSLPGTVTRPAEEAAPRTATPAPAPAPARTATPSTERTPAPPAAIAPSDSAERRAPRNATAPRESTTAPAASVSVTLPPADTPTIAYPSDAGAVPAAPVASDFPQIEDEATGAAGLGTIPWLLALLLLAGGAGYFIWRQRSAHALVPAGAGSQFRSSQPMPRAPSAPAPTPSPVPPQRAPAPRPPAPAPPTGIVTTRLRPWLEIELVPGRCIVDDQKATIEFEVSVFNSGSAPARDVLIEARLFNAGPAQDEEMGAFFAHPVAKGDRMPVIPQLKRIAIKSAVTLPRDQVRVFEVEGRRLFVPLIGFNALYRWSSGEGQTSASYLLGRDTNGDKLAPFRLDLGPRVFRGLGARAHTLRIRK